LAPTHGGALITHVATQTNVVTGLSAVADSDAVAEGTGSALYTVTATGPGGTVQDVAVQYQITDAAGNLVGGTEHCYDNTSATVGAEVWTNYAGQVGCLIPQPTPGPGQLAPFSVKFSLVNGIDGAGYMLGDPSVTSNTTTQFPVEPAPAGSTVSVTCTSTEKNTNSDCVQPTANKTTTFTAKVVAADGTTPVSGVGVTWTVTTTSGSDSATVSPTACASGADGTCSTTVTVNSPAQGDKFTVSAHINTGDGSGTLTYDDHFAGAPEKISVSAGKSTALPGSGDVITATVTNRFGNAAGANDEVFFTVSGAGNFVKGAGQGSGNGTTTATAFTNAAGVAKVVVNSNGSGTSNLTANLPPAGACTVTGGQCSATTSVTWGATGPKVSEHPVITHIHSRVAGRATIHVVSHPKVANASVHYFKVSASGHRTLLGTSRTNSAGKASKQFRGLTPGKTYRFQVVVHSGHNPGIAKGSSAIVRKTVK
jgi:hypothetical protein